MRPLYIDVYYDKALCKNYILTGQECFIKSYDYNENKLYHKCFNDDDCFLKAVGIAI